MPKKRVKVIATKVEEAPFASCSICGGSDDEDCIILCDTEGCKTETHMYCLFPPLFQVPVDKWYCEKCLSSKEGSGAQQNLMNYLTSFSSMIISLEPFNSVEKYLHWLRDLQHQYSDLNSYLCNSYKTSVLKSEFDSTSPNLIGSLVKLFYSSDGILYSGQCHTGRIVQRRSSHIGESNIRWEHLVHFKSGGDGRRTAVLEWVCLEEHACLVSCEVVWAKIDGFAVYWPCIKYYRSGVEISSGLANYYCGFDLLDSAIPDDAGGSSSVGTIERKRIEESSSSNTRAPPDYILCQAFLEDVFAFVPQSKVVPFLEKLRDSNSMTKRLSVAYAMAWIEVEEKETARRAYFSLPEEQENLSHSGLLDINGRMDDENDSAGNILAAICNAELQEFNNKKRNAPEEDCPDPEEEQEKVDQKQEEEEQEDDEQIPIEISSEINDLLQVSCALRYIIDAVIQNTETAFGTSPDCNVFQNSGDQNSNEMVVENSSNIIDQPISNSNSNATATATATEVRQYSIQPKLFDQFSAVDKAFLQMDAGIRFVNSKNSQKSDRIALCHFEQQPIPTEDYCLKSVFGNVSVSSFSFQDSLKSSYDCFRRDEDAAIHADLELERLRQAEEKLRIAAEKKRQREDRKLFAKEEKLAYAIRFALEREARAKALEQSRVEEEERRKKALEEEEQRQRQRLLLQEQKQFLQEPELQQAGTSGISTSEHVHDSSPVPFIRKRGKRGRKKKIVQDSLENNEEQQHLQLKSADSQLDSSALSCTDVKDAIHNSSIEAAENEELNDADRSREVLRVQPSSSIDVHDKDAITMMEIEPVKGRRELRLLSDISRDNWIGTIVYFDEKGDMGRVTAAGSGWITVRLVDGLLRRFRPYNLEEVDPTSIEYKSFEDREHMTESDTAQKDEKAFNQFNEDLHNGADFQPPQSKLPSLTMTGDDYLNMNIDSDLLTCNAEEPQEERGDVIDEPKMDHLTADELFQLFEEQPIETAVDNPIPSNTEKDKFSYPDRKFVPLNKKPPKVKYLQFSLSKEVFEQKYKATKPLTLMPKIDPKKSVHPISQHGPTALNEETKSASSTTVASSSSSSAVSQPPLPSGSGVQKVNRPGSMSRNLRLQRNRDDLSTMDDGDTTPSTISSSAVASSLQPPQNGSIKYITIMNEDGDLVSVPEPSSSSYPEDLNSDYDKQLPQQQQTKELVAQDGQSLQGQRLRRQQHILEQQRLAQQRQHPSHAKVIVEDPRNASFNRDEKPCTVSSENATPFSPALQISAPSNPIQNIILEEKLQHRADPNNMPMAANTVDNHNVYPEAPQVQTDGPDLIVRNTLDPRLRLLGNRKVSDPRVRGSSLPVAPELSNTTTIRGDRGDVDSIAPKNDHLADPVGLNEKKRKSRFSHHEPVSTSQDCNHEQFDVQHGSLQNPKRKSRFSQVPAAILPNSSVEDSFPPQTNDSSLAFVADSTHFHDNYNKVAPPYQHQQLEGGFQYPVTGWVNLANDNFYNETNRIHDSDRCEWKYPVPSNDVQGFQYQSLDVTRRFGEYHDPTAKDVPSNSFGPVNEQRCGIYGPAIHDESSTAYRTINESHHWLPNISVNSNIFDREFNSKENKVAEEESALSTASDSIIHSVESTVPSMEKSIPKNGLPPDNAITARVVLAAAAAIDPNKLELSSAVISSSKDPKSISDLEDGEVVEEDDLEEGEVVEGGEEDSTQNDPAQESVAVQEFGSFVAKPLYSEYSEDNVAVAMPIIAPCLPPMEVMFGHSILPLSESADTNFSNFEHLPLEKNDTFPERHTNSTYQSTSTHNLYMERQTNPPLNPPLPPSKYVRVGEQTNFMDRDVLTERTPYYSASTLTHHTRQNMNIYTERQIEPLNRPPPPPPQTAYIDGPPNHRMDVSLHPLPAYQNMTMERAIEPASRAMSSAHPSHSMFVTNNTYLEDTTTYHHNAYAEQVPAHNSDAIRAYNPSHAHHISYTDRVADHMTGLPPLPRHQYAASDFEPTANPPVPCQYLQWDSPDAPPHPPSNSHHHFPYNTESPAYPVTVAPPMHVHSNPSHYLPPPLPPRNQIMERHHSSQSQQHMFPNAFFPAPSPSQYSQP
eukprot:gene20758-26915_t